MRARHASDDELRAFERDAARASTPAQIEALEHSKAMNRRSFLWSVGLLACSQPAGRRPPPPPLPPRPHPPEAPREGERIVDDPLGAIRHSVQLERSRLAIAGDVIVHRSSAELRFLDAKTLRQLDSLATSYRDFCLLADGTIAAFFQADGASRCELHHIDSRRAVDVLRGPIYDPNQPSRVVSTDSAQRVFISIWENTIARFRLGRQTIEEDARIEIDPDHAFHHAQLASLGDGRLVIPDFRALQVLAIGTPTVRYPTTGHRLAHVAVASDKRVWYSHALEHSGVTGIALVRFANGSLVADVHVDLAPAWVVHMASGGGALAALIHTLQPDFENDTWSVIVLEESGKERWRAEIAKDLYGKQFDFNYGFVAISEHHVAVQVPDRPILAWDAATGARV